MCRWRDSNYRSTPVTDSPAALLLCPSVPASAPQQQPLQPQQPMEPQQQMVKALPPMTDATGVMPVKPKKSPTANKVHTDIPSCCC